MTLTFPQALDDFFSKLPVASVSFDLSEAIAVTETLGGEVQIAEYGTRLWSGSVSLHALRHDQADRFKAMIEAQRQAGRGFFVRNRPRRGPIADPDGSILGASTPAIASLPTNAHTLSLDGLPANYELSIGDLFSFQYDPGDGTRYALHRIVSQPTVDGLGASDVFEVVPALRPGAAAATAVTLVDPVCKAVIVPETTTPGNSGRVWTGEIGFSWRQTLK